MKYSSSVYKQLGSILDLQNWANNFRLIKVLVSSARRAQTIKEFIFARYGACILPQIINITSVEDVVVFGLNDISGENVPAGRLDRCIYIQSLINQLASQPYNTNYASASAAEISNLLTLLDGEGKQWESIKFLANHDLQEHKQEVLQQLQAVINAYDRENYLSDAAFLTKTYKGLMLSLANSEHPIICIGEGLNQEPLTHLFEHIEALDNGYYIKPEISGLLSQHNPNIKLYEFDDTHEEALGVLSKASDWIDQGLERIVIGASNPILKKHILAVARATGVAVNNSTGEMLSQTPYGVFALLLADLISSERLDYQGIGALLKHPLMLRELPKDRGNLVGSLRAINVLSYKNFDGILRSSECLMQFFYKLQGLPKKESLRELVKAHKELLIAAMGGLGEIIFKGSDGKALLEFLNNIENSLAGQTLKLSKLDYAQQFKNLLNLASPVFYHTNDARILLLDMYEIPTFEADGVIFCGFNAIHLDNVNLNPILGRLLDAKLGINLEARHHKAAEIALEYGLNLPNCVFTRAKKEGVVLQEAASSWLKLLAKNKLSVFAAHKPIKEFTPFKVKAAEIKVTNAIDKLQRLTISDVELLMRDPYGLAAKYIFGLKPIRYQDDPLGRDKFGNLIHNILERLVSQRIYDQGNIYKFKESIKQELSKNQEAPYILAFWWPRFSLVIDAIHERLKSNPSPVIFVEKPIEGIFEGITIAGKIDRLDINDSIALVIDYKTGTIPTKREVIQGYAPQLSLEAIILEQDDLPANSLEFWQIKGAIEEALKITDFSWEEEDKQRVSNGIKDVFHYCLLRETKTFLACPNPDEMPTYNIYKHLERLDEWIFNQ